MHPTQNLSRTVRLARHRHTVHEGDDYGTPADTLRCAATYLITHGWHQGDRFADTAAGNPFPPASADGAIRAAVYGHPNDTAELAGKPGWHVDIATAALADWLGLADILDSQNLLGWLDDSTDAVADWNDTPGRTLHQVLQALHDAAEDYDHTVAYAANGGAR